MNLSIQYIQYPVNSKAKLTTRPFIRFAYYSDSTNCEFNYDWAAANDPKDSGTLWLPNGWGASLEFQRIIRVSGNYDSEYVCCGWLNGKLWCCDKYSMENKCENGCCIFGEDNIWVKWRNNQYKLWMCCTDEYGLYPFGSEKRPWKVETA